VLKPAEQTPVSILLMAEMIQDLLPKGVLNIVNGYGLEAGKPLASSPRVAKVAFTGETSTGKLILKYASDQIIPVTLELGGKSPNIFMQDIFDQPDSFVEKALEGFALFALNQGEVCTCPSRALIHESIYSRFMDLALARVGRIKMGHPLDTETMMGAQASSEQMEKIQAYIKVAQGEGAKLALGGKVAKVEGLEKGYYFEPTIFEGKNHMRIFQEEIFGPVVSVASFKNVSEAVQMANDTSYGLGAGVWTRNIHAAHELSHQIKAGRVWVNCYHLYPAHASFGGYKQSGLGRETHKMMLSHYTQTKNILTSYDPNPMGFF
jgi:aldehyde dehydrogenase